jgi:uncharacterized membrane protein
MTSAIDAVRNLLPGETWKRRRVQLAHDPGRWLITRACAFGAAQTLFVSARQAPEWAEFFVVQWLAAGLLGILSGVLYLFVLAYFVRLAGNLLGGVAHGPRVRAVIAHSLWPMTLALFLAALLHMIALASSAPVDHGDPARVAPWHMVEVVFAWAGIAGTIALLVTGTREVLGLRKLRLVAAIAAGVALLVIFWLAMAFMGQDA